MSSTPKARGVIVLEAPEVPLHVDISDMTHPNRMVLATIIDDFGPSTEYTNVPFYGSSFGITSRLGSAELVMIDGFHECGSFVVLGQRPDVIQQLAQARQTLEEKAQSKPIASVAVAEICQQIIHCLPGGTKLSSQTPTGGRGHLVKITAFTIFTYPNMPCAEPKEDTSSVWKWTKPNSPYLKWGFWQTNLSDAIIDGGLRGGKD